MKHYIFDVDGTLTVSRQKMDTEFRNWFEHFATHNAVYFVTGSDRLKTEEQLSPGIYNLAMKVFQCSGSEVYAQNRLLYSHPCTMPQYVYLWLEERVCLSSFRQHRTGYHIEQRVGTCNFSVLGRGASPAGRAAYIEHDAELDEREFITNLFNETFEDLHATIGGETGIDIGPRGFDKSQILSEFKDSDHIAFYGDKMQPGGNDYPLGMALQSRDSFEVYEVTDWRHTWKLLQE